MMLLVAPSEGEDRVAQLRKEFEDRLATYTDLVGIQTRFLQRAKRQGRKSLGAAMLALEVKEAEEAADDALQALAEEDSFLAATLSFYMDLDTDEEDGNGIESPTNPTFESPQSSQKEGSEMN